MRSRVQLFGGGVLVLLSVTGCPVTDNYYIEAGQAVAGQAVGGTAGVENTGETGSGALSGSSGGGAAQGGATQGGTAGDVAVTTGGVIEPVGGASAAGQPADAGSGPVGPCVPTTERCNGHDDDCDDLVDELACNTNANGTTGCTGFALMANPNHGYMLCTGTAKDYTHAKEACAGQEMRLAWLESAAENTAVAATIKKLTTQDILFGATDAAKEGDWLWDGTGGFQFWKGDENGAPVGGHFTAWAPSTPNDANNGEDCIVMAPATAFWGDRTCFGYYAYLCEDLSP